MPWPPWRRARKFNTLYSPAKSSPVAYRWSSEYSRCFSSEASAAGGSSGAAPVAPNVSLMPSVPPAPARVVAAASAVRRMRSEPDVYCALRTVAPPKPLELCVDGAAVWLVAEVVVREEGPV
jgi:hypothetical protein